VVLTVFFLLYADRYFSFNSKFFLPTLVAFDLGRHSQGINEMLAFRPEFRNVNGPGVGCSNLVRECKARTLVLAYQGDIAFLHIESDRRVDVH